ncbi:TPA: YbfB/YjiJ family MFS transporter [Proteus mirabilis]|uniref:YbfB/YjiJ family MFS transporter n=1 Tax=Proteus mirabilis TaxID=584 RepID=UPI00073BBD81|nr:YbfB/YjiJ family MFS transporter [Proteus mirabilis]AZG98076.1 YbfB/YjiJ family MFS transporter [Proteus mirabilis]KSX99587.1 MFS transporter [Proteus mirabilis]MBS3851920.1 YbfB/YjiJ family MFS transporter [Proteus mirabilis]MCI9766731.1 YbfB/YjiJ family MFS transporter [Proteus mirabilis]MCI9770318.1 YbfB/YjiJ family MFS transporter [Proteus mirabilis]
MNTSTHPSHSAQAFHIAFSGFLALVVAMGIGRFTFTPQVPLMIADTQLTLTSASIVAAFNYLGYLAGSYDAMKATKGVGYRLWGGLWGAVIITLLSAVLNDALTHSIARFFIGWASGWTLVLVASWANEVLARLNRPALSVAVYAGTGAGIFISGLLAVFILKWQMSATAGWLIYGVLAFICAIYVSYHLPKPWSINREQVKAEPLILTPAMKRLILGYTFAGFGYILPATFLSQMATERFPGSLVAQFVWPIFGASAALCIGIAILTRNVLNTQLRLAITLWLQALGIIIAEWLPTITGLAIGAFLVGGGLMCAVQLAFLRGKELAPDHARYMAGLLTTFYAIGQLVGPLVSFLSTALTGRLEPALYVAFVILIIGGILVCMKEKNRG